MLRDDRSREGGDMYEDGDYGPGQAFMTFVAMETLLDKLKLLNYDTDFVKSLKMKPIHRHYFAVQTNPGEQFFLFTSLAAWLIRKTGKPCEQPQEYDDPNSTISGILDVVRQLGGTIDFPPSKLKQGFGEHAVSVLSTLVDAAMQATGFTWQKPKPPVELDDDEGVIEDESELILEKVEEEMAAEYSDEDSEETLLHIDDLQHVNFGKKHIQEPARPEEILESNMDTEKWKLELERVLPQLKVTVKSDPRDWRSHLEQMQSHRAGIEEALATARLQLDRLHAEISRTLEKIASREKYLNAQLEPALAQFRHVQDEFSRLSEQYGEVSGGVAERSRALASLTEELDAIKQEMEERGSSMTDGTPVVSIKKAITSVRAELTAMDVRTGVLEHSLLQARLRDKNQQRMEAGAVTPLAPTPTTLISI